MRRTIGALFAIWLSGSVMPLAGQSADVITPGQERATFVVGIFLPGFDTNLRINNVELGQGTRLNLQDSIDYRFWGPQVTFKARL
jgi:hypothetical protein